MTRPEFRRDLYRGTARYYDRFRLPYPRDLIEDLARRSGADGTGRALDLACGTGQLSLALCRRFGEVWAADQEPDMIGVAGEKAAAAGVRNLRLLTSAAEELVAPEQSFDLVTIGNAFHRLPRDVVCADVLRWLRPGGHLALVWGGTPWDGAAPWQLALSATVQRWTTTVGSRIPSGYEQDRRQRPDPAVLRAAGFQLAGKREFRVTHDWTIESLIGFALSTSVLSAAALGNVRRDFESDLRQGLSGLAPDGRFRQIMEFACEMVRRPLLNVPENGS